MENTTNATKTSVTINATPDTIKYLVKGLLQDVSSKGRFCSLVYKTATGEIVTRTVRAGVKKHLKVRTNPEDIAGAQEAEKRFRINNPDIFRVWDLSAAAAGKKKAKEAGKTWTGSAAYRSYNINNLVSVTGMGKTVIIDHETNDKIKRKNVKSSFISSLSALSMISYIFWVKSKYFD